MNNLYFIRHAQSEANIKRIQGSQLPFPLTAEGKADADLIARELKALLPIHHIVTSPLVRAKQTAESFAAAFDLSILEEENLAEQYLGDYSGMSYDDLAVDKEYEKDPLNRWDWVPRGGGESYKMIAERVLEFFKDLEENPLRGNTLIVTHAVTFRLIQACLENTLPVYPKPFPNNGEIRRVKFMGLGKKHRMESIFLGNSREFVHNP
ncbi:MAG: histidine phosphatase family protein [Spirochaetales bacterium]|nr:histidine phosphatase family protein [Spirochaetales bacterium]